MANVLTMAKSQSIQQLHTAGWSGRRIASELGIDRGTVARHLQAAQAAPNPAILPPGSDGSNAATFPGLPAPLPGDSPGADVADFVAAANAAILPPGSPPAPSKRKKGTDQPAEACQT